MCRRLDGALVVACVVGVGVGVCVRIAVGVAVCVHVIGLGQEQADRVVGRAGRPLREGQLDLGELAIGGLGRLVHTGGG